MESFEKKLTKIQGLLTFDLKNLNEQIAEIPSWLGYLSFNKGKLEYKKLQETEKLEKLEGQLYFRYKEELGSKTTETAIKHKMNCDEKIIEQRRVINSLNYKIKQFTSAFNVLKLKSDSAFNIGNNLRKEISNHQGQ